MQIVNIGNSSFSKDHNSKIRPQIHSNLLFQDECQFIRSFNRDFLRNPELNLQCSTKELRHRPIAAKHSTQMDCKILYFYALLLQINPYISSLLDYRYVINMNHHGHNSYHSHHRGQRTEIRPVSLGFRVLNLNPKALF